MTREELTRLAVECGAVTRIYEKAPGLDHIEFEMSKLEQFVEEILRRSEFAALIADAIRARGKE